MMMDNKSIQYHRFRSGRWEVIESGVIIEAPVSLTVNGDVWLTFMCTPSNLEALAVGFLFNEGIIQSLSDIVEKRVCAKGDNVDVWLDREVGKPKNWKRTSGCTGGVTMIDVDNTFPELVNGFTIDARSVNDLIERLIESQELYHQVGGVHTSVLTDGDNISIVAEDIGRHNTIDKIAGICLLKDLQLQKKILLTTGRISSEMLQKAVRIGAAIVISRTSPSSLSIELALKWGITLIGYARRERFNVYSHPGRIDNHLVENAIFLDP